MILKLLLNTQMIRMIFIYMTLKNGTQIENVEYWLSLMIWLLTCFVIKNLNSVVTELFTRDRKLNIYIVFITRSYCTVPKHIRLNSTH